MALSTVRIISFMISGRRAPDGHKVPIAAARLSVQEELLLITRPFTELFESGSDLCAARQELTYT